MSAASTSRRLTGATCETRAPGATRSAAHARRRQAGVALVMVIVVLVAMALVATPFALSMRNLESGALLASRQEEARAGAGVALAAARRHLEDTHPYYDEATPLRDTRAELFPDDLDERYPDLLPRDPLGSIRSVRGEDESGKVHLGTASPWLLGNLLGGRSRLSAGVDADDTLFTLVDATSFPPTGLALVGAELVEYSQREAAVLGEVVRGFSSANLERSLAVPHALGSEVLDVRLVLLLQRAWRVLPGSYEPFRRVEGLMDLGLFGEANYSAAELERARDALSVHGPPPTWTSARRVLGLSMGRDGGVDLLLDDASGFGAGSVLRLTDDEGVFSYGIVVEAVDWGDAWHVSLLEPPPRGVSPGTSTVAVLVRAPVNVNTAEPRVLVALLEGLASQPVRDVVNDDEAASLSLDITQNDRDARDDEFVKALQPGVVAGDYSDADVRAAQQAMTDAGLRPGELDVVELAGFLAGRRSLGGAHRLGHTTAVDLAGRIAAGKPGSHEELRALLTQAVAEGLAKPSDVDLVLRNAVDPGDPELLGGTAPFTYASAGVFTLEAADIENLPNGREAARAHVREIVSVAPPGSSAHLYETQADFERALEQGVRGGWESGPNPLLGGPLTGRVATLAELESDRPARADDLPSTADMRTVLEVAEVRPTRTNTLLGGRAGPAGAGVRSWITPKSARSGLPGTLHFDEGQSALLGATPDGFDFAQGAVRLSVDELVPELLTRTTRFLQPFSVEFWVEFDDPAAETLVFDMGADHLEDRISLVLREGVLVFRIADTSLADFDTGMSEGRDPPAGEIRYAFDDGLELRAGVPYHVALYAGGARDTLMALFVDGVPRGQRSSTTRLLSDLEAVGALGESAENPRRKVSIPVESTAGFPVRGAIRIGGEILEYVEKTDDAFIVRAAGADDPFGGRSRRTTVGREHEASELVELVGYSRPLASELMARGDGDLAGQLGPFAVAEVDPSTLSTTIEVTVQIIGATPEPLTIGTGFDSNATTIPLRGLDGGNLASGTFQQGGGYAILYCDYGPLFTGSYTPVGTQGTATLDARTPAGEAIGGAEVIRYTGFDGSRLTGCSRGASGIPVSLGPQGSDLASIGGQDYVAGGGRSTWADSRAWVTTFDPAFKGAITGVTMPDEARVVVVPISVAVNGSLAEFHPSPNGVLSGKSWFVQIGLDFDAPDLTEWARWDTPTSIALVRDDQQAVQDTMNTLGSWNGGELWNADVPAGGDLAEALNATLDFRGQAGTQIATHATGERVLPVHVFGRWGSNGNMPVVGLPGRHDVVTLVAPDGTREQQIINHAVNDDFDWGPDFTLVAYRDAIQNEFGWTDENEDGNYVVPDRDLEAALLPGAQGARLMEELQLQRKRDLEDVIRRFNVDSRLVTRMLKAPTGELPSAEIARVEFGEAFDGRASPGRATIDELRFHRQDVAGPLLPADLRFVLAEPLEFDEDGALVLGTELAYTNHTFLQQSLLGKEKLEILAELPQTGGLLLLGEEIVAYTGMDPIETGAVFLSGRGLYGTRRARHERLEPVVPLLFWPASPLTGSMGVDEAVIPVADPTAFPPDGGLVFVDEELLAYDHVDEDGLHMPERPSRGGGGVLRGRFGSTPEIHRAGALVRWMPMRHADDALLGESVPESSLLVLPVSLPGAFVEDVSVRIADADPLAQLAGRIVLDGRASPHADPLTTAGLFELPERETSPGLWTARILSQADRLELALGVLWLPGAFDATRFTSNAWKIVPRVEAVAVRHIQPTVVLEHDEWR